MPPTQIDFKMLRWTMIAGIIGLLTFCGMIYSMVANRAKLEQSIDDRLVIVEKTVQPMPADEARLAALAQWREDHMLQVTKAQSDQADRWKAFEQVSKDLANLNGKVDASIEGQKRIFTILDSIRMEMIHDRQPDKAH